MNAKALRVALGTSNNSLGSTFGSNDSDNPPAFEQLSPSPNAHTGYSQEG